MRDAVVGWIGARRRQRLADEIEQFATAEAGTGLDFDTDLEAAGIENLLAGERQ